MEKINEYLVQWLYRQLLNASSNYQFYQLKNRIFNKLFNGILKSKEPLIKYNIAGFPLWVPISHHLPFILKNHPQYSSNIARIAKYVKQKYKDLKFIDIGANIGDSIAIVRKEAEFPILCIEGDEQFLSILKKNADSFLDVYIARAYLGESNKSFKGFNFKDGGTAHLKEKESFVGESVIEVKKLSDVLKDYPSFLDSKMIKIDTDGFDCKILRGASDVLTVAKPVIFFEYDPFFLSQQGDDGISIFKYFMHYGYNNLLIYDNFGDLMLSTSVDNERLLHEIHLYFSGRWGHRYCDICVFHQEDNNLFEVIREQEIQFFKQFRSIK